MQGQARDPGEVDKLREITGDSTESVEELASRVIEESMEDLDPRGPILVPDRRLTQSSTLRNHWSTPPEEVCHESRIHAGYLRAL
jgi:hypothetical protein